MGRPFERVYTVHDYWDGPRAGFADFNGVPHAYRSVFRDDLDDYDPCFRLAPVSPETMERVLEDWAIWRRWEDAFHAGDTDRATHPALPADRARHAELAPVIERALDIPETGCIRAEPTFRAAGGVRLPSGRSREVEVRWTVVPADTERT